MVLLRAGVAAAALPDPLDLHTALERAEWAHPDLERARAEVAAAAAEAQRVRAGERLRADLELEGRWIDPSPVAVDDSRNDSRAHLRLHRQLYDFGRTRAREAAAGAERRAARSGLVAARIQRQLEVLERYLDVLDADLAYRVADEAHAIAYIRYDRTRHRHRLKQVSDVALLKSQARYQAARGRRIEAGVQQRLARHRLAEALGVPDAPPANLDEAPAVALPRPFPDADRWIRRILDANPALARARARERAAADRLRAARHDPGPVLDGELEASAYYRDFGFRDRLRAKLILDVPLWTGGLRDAGLAAARARLRQARADRARLTIATRTRVVALVEAIQAGLQRRKEVAVGTDYRDLDLDRSRALYEMEFNADLGDAMVLWSRAHRRERRLEYDLLRDWAELAALEGRTPMEVIFGHGDKDTETGRH